MILPILKYPGGKTREFSIIQKNLPSYANYYEPFLGGGAVWLNVTADQYFVNDISSDLMNLYTYIQTQNQQFFQIISNIDKLWDLKAHYAFIADHSELLLEEVNAAPFLNELFERLVSKINYFGADTIFKTKLQATFLRKQKKFSQMTSGEVVDSAEAAVTTVKDTIYQMFRELYNKTDSLILKTALYWYLREFSYCSMFRFNLRGEFNAPYGGRSYNAKFLTSKLDRARSLEVMNKLSQTTLSNTDFQDFLENFAPTQKDFVFLDPPYDSEFSTYDQHIFDQAEQVRLAEYLKHHLNSQFMLVIKETDFVHSLYHDGEETLGGVGNLQVLSFEKCYQVSFKNRNNKLTNHLMITNYKIEKEGE